MSRLILVMVLGVTSAAAVALQTQPPRIAIIQARDEFTKVDGLSDFLAAENIAFKDLSSAFEAGTLPDLKDIDLLIIGSFVTNDAEKRATYRKAGDRLQAFVSGGGVVAVLDQADQDHAEETWLPASHRLKRTDPDFAAAIPLQADHPLLNAAAPLSAAELKGWRTPTDWRGDNTIWEALSGWAEAAVILGSSDSNPPEAAGLVEMGWGRGRAVFYAMAPDKAFVCGNAAAKAGGTKLLRNLIAYSAQVKDNRAPAIRKTEAPGYKHPIQGVVYLDANGNGQRDAGENGLPGLAVSDGAEVVLTDDSGAYRLLNSDRKAVFAFVHQTGGYKQNGQSFFRRLDNDGQAEDRYDIGLEPAPKSTGSALRFVQLTDSHIRGVDDRNYMIQATSEIYAMDPPPDFVVATGDLVDWGVDEHFQNYVAGMQKPLVPYFNVFGNHEIYMGPLSRYHEYIGPDYYSFERGGVLFLALNCVTPTARQTGWLEQTLKTLGTGRPVVVFQHFPPTVEEMERFAKLNVKSVFSGHWHSEKEHEHAGVQSINSPTFIMGGIDASPAGFKIVHLKDDGSVETEWRYGFQNQRLTIVSPQKGAPADHSYFPVVVNAYDTRKDVAAAEWRLGSGDQPTASGTLRRESATSWAGGHGHPHPHPHPAKSSKAVATAPPPGSYPFEVNVRDQRGATWSSRQQVVLIAGPPAVPAPGGDWPMFMGGATHLGHVAKSIGTFPLRLVWSTDTGGDPDFTSPILGDGRLYIGLKKRTRGRSNGVAAFHPVSGEKLWVAETDMAVNHTPAYFEGVVCAAAMGGRVYGFAADSGRELWHHDLIDSDGRFSYCAPAIHEGAFYAGVMRRFAKLRPSDGRLEWDTAVGGADSDWISSYGSPAGDGQRVIMSGRFSKGDSLVALKTDDGGKIWGHRADGGTLGSATIAGDRVLFATNKSTLHCLQLEDGRTLWRCPLGGEGTDPNWSATTPAVKVSAEGEGIVVAGSGDGRMSGINLANGEILWTHVSDSSVFKVSPYRRDSRPLLSSPTIAGDHVFFGSADGTLYGLDLRTGKQVWSFVIGVPVMSTPLVSGNVLFVAAYDGRLYAFTSQTE